MRIILKNERRNSLVSYIGKKIEYLSEGYYSHNCLIYQNSVSDICVFRLLHVKLLCLYYTVFRIDFRFFT